MSDVFDELFDQAQEDEDQRIADLVDRLTRAKNTYYNDLKSGQAKLDISDAEYDAMENELRRVDANHAFLKTVGAPAQATSGWQKVRHEAPMGSLNKAQPGEADDPHAEFRAWWVSTFGNAPQDGKALVVWSDKCDGISLSQKYADGNQARALTRGDGEIGEDITSNVWLMKGRKTSLKGFSGHIRGEIVLRKSDWHTHFPEYSNPRNAASGIAKRQSDPAPCKHLTVLHYQLLRDSTPGMKALTHKEQEFKILAAFGFAVPNWGTISTVDEAVAVYEEFVAGKREGLDYLIDGLVFEANNLEFSESLGLRNNRPKAAIAFKFPHEKKPSILRELVWQVGKSGRVTPVANVDPVRLAGANVARASLHNLSNIAKLAKGHRAEPSLAVGDTVLVSRRNDVIPYIESVITPDPNGRLLAAPTVCPECAEDLSMQGEYLVCTNSAACPAQVAGLLVRWVEKIGVKGWGSTIIEALVAADTVSEPADLYNLDPNELAKVELDGRKIGSTAHTVVKELRDKGMDLSLHVFIGSLGIPLCARSVAKMIVDAGYDDLAKMRSATLTEIASVPRLGDTKARSFVNGLLDRSDIIDNLLAAGVTIKPPSDGPLKGLTVCMTGFRDPSMTVAIEDAGGTVKSSVGKALSILVAGDPKSTSGKAKKARGYGVEIIGPDDMWTRLGGRP